MPRRGTRSTPSDGSAFPPLRASSATRATESCSPLSRRGSTFSHGREPLDRGDEMKATLERELKLGAGPRFRLPHLPGEPLASRTLTNIYLDTPDHRLALAGVPLRRRIEGRKGLWQLKLP